MEGNTEFQKTLQEQPELPKLVPPLAKGGLVDDLKESPQNQKSLYEFFIARMEQVRMYSN